MYSGSYSMKNVNQLGCATLTFAMVFIIKKITI